MGSPTVPHRLAARPVDAGLRAPRYHQVYVALRDWMASGRLGAGARLPPEPALCEAFGVSRITVRRAIDELVAEGLVQRRQGSGTYVRAQPAPHPVDLREMTLRVSNLGRSTRVADLSVEWVEADGATRAAMELTAGALVHKSRRVRVREGERLGLVTAWVREDVGRRLRRAELRQATVLELIERAGCRVASAEQTLGATLADVDSARALAVPVGAPLVRIERVVRDADGRPVERVEALWRADAYEYRMQLVRARRGELSGWVAD